MNSDEIKKQKARENSRRYYQRNKERILKQQKEYKRKRYNEDDNFRKKVNQLSRNWQEKNKEHYMETKRDCQRKRIEKLRKEGIIPKTKKQKLEEIKTLVNTAKELGINMIERKTIEEIIGESNE